MKLARIILTGVTLFGLTSGAVQAYMITHSTDGVLFHDDMEGGTFAAEVGNWGTGNTWNNGDPMDAVTEMVTGAEAGGPAGAFSGNDYGKISRVNQQVLCEAILKHPVSSGTLTLETAYWLNIDYQEIGTVDNRKGKDTDPSLAQVYITNWDNQTNWRNQTSIHVLPGTDTAVPVLKGKWNTLKIVIDLDKDTVQVWINGEGGSVVTTNSIDAVSRFALRIGDGSGSAFYLDAGPTSKSQETKLPSTQDAGTTSLPKDNPASDWKPLVPDEYTVALYRFDEGKGNEAHCATGDPELTLRAKAARWGERPGGGAVARFERREDDATVFVGPTNNDKLHLRACHEAWTVEARVRYTGEGGQDIGGTYGNICGNDDEGFGLDGRRGGWNMLLWGGGIKRKDGLAPGARFMGCLRGRDGNHDTSSYLLPTESVADKRWHTPLGGGFIRDTGWHHVAWQFRYADQTHYFYIDKRLIFSMQLPPPGSSQGEVVNDSRNVGVPFTVGGFVHSQDPPFVLGYGNFEGEIADLRISNVMRYPVVDGFSIVKRRGRCTNNLSFIAGEGLPFETAFTTDGADGPVRWTLIEGELPDGLSLDATSGVVSGRPRITCEPHKVTLQATDKSGNTDRHQVAFAVRPGSITTVSLPPAFVGGTYDVLLNSEYLEAPLKWEMADGALPKGLRIEADRGSVSGTPAARVAGPVEFRVRVTDARGIVDQQALSISVLPAELCAITPDEHTMFLYGWQGPKARLIHDAKGDEGLALDWTNMGGDRRVEWPGREGRFPQEPGHGEFGYASLAKNNDKHNLRTCSEAWTVEAWVRRGGSLLGFADKYPRADAKRFDFGHVCGTYDNTKRGTWEMYLSNHKSPDGSMAPGVHFLGAEPEQALMDLHPWTRPEGIVGEPALVGIHDTEWHHVAWQYNYAEDLHQLFLDGRLIWQMRGPDGRKLVNNRQHDAQFSVFTRLNGYVIRGSGDFNYHKFGNFFGQIGEIRVSNVRRY